MKTQTDKQTNAPKRSTQATVDVHDLRHDINRQINVMTESFLFSLQLVSEETNIKVRIFLFLNEPIRQILLYYVCEPLRQILYINEPIKQFFKSFIINNVNSTIKTKLLNHQPPRNAQPSQNFLRATNFKTTRNAYLKSFTIQLNQSLFQLSTLPNPNDIIHCVATHLKIHKSSFFLTINGYTLCNENISLFQNPIIKVNIRLRGGTQPRNDNPITTNSRTQLIFLDSDGSPSSWFRIFETRTSQTPKLRPELLLDSIPNELMSELGPKIADALDSNKPYENLKAVILKKYAPTPSASFNKLIKPQTYYGQSPITFLTQAITDLENIHTGLSKNNAFLCNYFLNALPTNIQNALLVVDSDDPFHLAKVAEKLMNRSTPPQPSSNLVTTHHDTAIYDQIAALTKAVSALTTKPNPKTSNPEQQQETTHALTCYFHKKFQSESKTCCIGCSWQDPLPGTKILPTCIYHNIFGIRAIKCLTGCTYQHQTTHNAQTQSTPSKN